jgi:hypothetical protein
MVRERSIFLDIYRVREGYFLGKKYPSLTLSPQKTSIFRGIVISPA